MALPASSSAASSQSSELPLVQLLAKRCLALLSLQHSGALQLELITSSTKVHQPEESTGEAQRALVSEVP